VKRYTEEQVWELLLAAACFDKLREKYTPREISDTLRRQQDSGETLASVYFDAGNGRYLSIQIWAEHDPDAGCDGLDVDSHCYPLREFEQLIAQAQRDVALH
jgi:hypothetical protein